MNRQGRPLPRGFTLLELIVVITIIGILGTFVVMKVHGLPGKARQLKAREDARAIVRAAEVWKTSTGRYPQSLDEMKTGKGPGGEDIGISLDLKLDPWQRPYEYWVDESGAHVRSLGQNGVQGGEGEDEDIEEPAPDAQ